MVIVAGPKRIGPGICLDQRRACALRRHRRRSNSQHPAGSKRLLAACRNCGDDKRQLSRTPKACLTMMTHSKSNCRLADSSRPHGSPGPQRTARILRDPGHPGSRRDVTRQARATRKPEGGNLWSWRSGYRRRSAAPPRPGFEWRQRERDIHAKRHRPAT